MLEKPTILPAEGLGLCALKERIWNCKAALALQCCCKKLFLPDLRVDYLIPRRLKVPERFLLQPVSCKYYCNPDNCNNGGCFFHMLLNEDLDWMHR